MIVQHTKHNLSPLQRAILAHAAAHPNITGADVLAINEQLKTTTSVERSLNKLVARNALVEDEDEGIEGAYIITSHGLAMLNDKPLPKPTNVVLSPTFHGVGKYISHIHNCQENVRTGADDHMAYPSRHEGCLYYRDGTVEPAHHG